MQYFSRTSAVELEGTILVGADAFVRPRPNRKLGVLQPDTKLKPRSSTTGKGTNLIGADKSRKMNCAFSA